ncbi:MAG TPA: hypothetical protein VKU39_21220, partial [Streptosporangiaceae bacterium]|nr:hypothetical protein [Streptosporangiaceae bacterium]
NLSSDDVGTWQIHLTAPPGLASQLVSATVFWQGAVRAIITANPPSAKVGQQISVTLSVLGPSGPITDPATLQSLLVGVTASGDGLPSPVRVPVSSSASAGPGNYTGTFAAPRQAGSLTVTGTAAGYGLYPTDIPATVTVGTATAGFNATVQMPVVTSVQAGSSITGQVIFTNQTGSARHVRLALSTSGADAAITGPVGLVTASAGSPPAVPFTIAFPADSPIGSAWLQVKVADAVNPGLVYDVATLNVRVTKPPGFFAKYLWDIIGIIIAIIAIILALLWRRAVIRRRKDTRGLVAVLRRNGEQLGRELPAPNRWSDVFRFTIRDEAGPDARLDFPQAGLSEYQVRRSGPGEVRLLTPTGGEPYDVVLGGPGETMEHNGLELAFRDTRRRRGGSALSRGTPRATPRGTPRPAAAPPPSSANGSGTQPPTPAAQKDEWL